MPGARALCSRLAVPGHLYGDWGGLWGQFPVHLFFLIRLLYSRGYNVKIDRPPMSEKIIKTSYESPMTL